MGRAEQVYHIWRAQRQTWPLPQGEAMEPVIQARYNWGRWIADCPFCSGAEDVEPNDPRFYCCSPPCNNKPAGHKWLPVVFPREWQAIEAVLSLRPEVSTQSWEPGEKVSDLQRENRERGLK